MEGESGWVFAGCHIKGILSLATGQRPKILHSDGSPHQQQLFQKARHREEATPYFSRP